MRRSRFIVGMSVLLAALMLALGGCGPDSGPPAAETSGLPPEVPGPTLTISSPAFEPEGQIASRHSCHGDNVSPALEWSGVPAEAQSLVLLVYDLDAGARAGASTAVGFAHWILYNIPPSTTGLPEDVPAGDALEDGALQGENDFAPFQEAGAMFPGGAPVKLIGYDGPCPPSKHRYTFNLYALDIVLDLPPAATMAQVLEAMDGHVLAQAGVIGFYAPPGG